MRPPECDVCGAEVGPGIDPVVFVPDAPTDDAPTNAVPADPPPVGHPSDAGWFCDEHVDAALDAARTATYRDGIARVIAATAPFDPREHRFTDPAGLPDPEAVPSRTRDDVEAVLATLRPLLVEAIGPARPRGGGVFGTTGPDGGGRSIDYQPAGEHRLFKLSMRRPADGNLAGSDSRDTTVRIEQRIEQRGEVRAVLRMDVADPGAAGGSLERLTAWTDDQRFEPWLAAAAGEFRTPPSDLLDPSPDLSGVDLAGGTLGADRRHGEQRWVEWTIEPIFTDFVVAAIPGWAAEVARTQGYSFPDEVTSETRRTWTPMDGAREPHCPFSDRTTASGESSDLRYSVSLTKAHWGPGDVDNVSLGVRLQAVVEGVVADQEDLLDVSAWGRGGDVVTTVRLARPTSGSSVAAVADLLASLPQSEKRRRRPRDHRSPG